MTYRVSIVGLGVFADGLLEPADPPGLGMNWPTSHAGAIAVRPDATLLSVCDLNPQRLASFEGRWRTHFPAMTCHPSMSDLFASEVPDILIVATPDNRHRTIVEEAVAAGVRAILCEKPLATTREDGRAMIRLCQEKNVALVIDHTRRWYPNFHEAIRRIKAGVIGRVTHTNALFGGPRAMLFRNATHLVHGVFLLTGQTPRTVRATLDAPFENYPGHYAGDGGTSPDTDPAGSISITMTDGATAHVRVARSLYPTFELDVIGDKGRIVLGTHKSQMEILSHNNELDVTQIRHTQTTDSHMRGPLSETILQLEATPRSYASALEAETVLHVLLAALESNAAGGQAIDLTSAAVTPFS